MNRLSLVIADDEYLVCEMLAKIIDFDGIQLDLIGTASDGESLFTLINELNPDIVLTDISMPKADGLSIIARARDAKLRCRFVIISGYRQFEYAYNALKHDVSDYILKPVNANELNTTLSKIATEIRQASSGSDNEGTSALYSYFLRTILPSLAVTPQPIDLLNKKYSLKLSPGHFCAIVAKLDFKIPNFHVQNDVDSVLSKLNRLIADHLSPLCFDVVPTVYFDAVAAVLNYPAEQEDVIQAKLQTVYTSGCETVALFKGMSLTLCVGPTVDSIPKAQYSLESAAFVKFSRMFTGISKVIYYDPEVEETPEQLRKELAEMMDQLSKAFESLDANGAHLTLKRLANMPSAKLKKVAVRNFFTEVTGITKKTIEKFCNELPEAEANVLWEASGNMTRFINLSTNFDDMLKNVIKQVEFILSMLSQNAKNKRMKPIRQALEYINSNYCHPLSLEEIAKVVNLSPAYFSSLFKKETGQNFSDYLVGVRIDKAKELLKRSDANVNEIADAVGFQDARYFSKLFKRRVGVKPSEFRKIYS